MSAPRNEMELKEEAVRAHYAAAAEMLMGIDHAPRLATAKLTVMAAEKSPEVAGMQRRFRSTTPGLVTRSMARSEGVRLIDRIALADDDDPLTSPLQAATAHALRRASGDVVAGRCECATGGAHAWLGRIRRTAAAVCARFAGAGVWGGCI